jgi:phage tail-like protein
MPGHAPEPFEASRFSVDLGTGDATLFSRVELPVATLGEVTFRSGSDRTAEARRQPGLASYTHLVLHRALTTNLDLWQWWELARHGDPSVDRNVVVRLLDEVGSPRLTWKFRNAFPVVHRVSTLDGSSSDVVVESIELAFDSMDAET